MMGSWFDMAGYGLVHWLLFALTVAVFLYPIGRILGRMGFSPFLSVLALVPLVNLLGLWIVALVDWPNRRGSEA